MTCSLIIMVSVHREYSLSPHKALFGATALFYYTVVQHTYFRAFGVRYSLYYSSMRESTHQTTCSGDSLHFVVFFLPDTKILYDKPSDWITGSGPPTAGCMRLCGCDIQRTGSRLAYRVDGSTTITTAAVGCEWQETSQFHHAKKLNRGMSKHFNHFMVTDLIIVSPSVSRQLLLASFQRHYCRCTINSVLFLYVWS